MSIKMPPCEAAKPVDCVATTCIENMWGKEVGTDYIDLEIEKMGDNKENVEGAIGHTDAISESRTDEKNVSNDPKENNLEYKIFERSTEEDAK